MIDEPGQGLAGTPRAGQPRWAEPLAGKRVLIIGGGGGGNGSAITKAVSDAGAAAVAIVDIDPTRAQEESDKIGVGRRVLAIAADVRSSAEIERVVSTTAREFGGIDVLITVVGGHHLFAPWQDMTVTTDDQWQVSFDINLTYVFRVVRATVRRFIEQGEGGSIVSIGSICGDRSSPMAVAYGAAKAALVSFARTVSLEYARQGIRMNVVSIGAVATPAQSLTEEVVGSIPLGRLGTVEELANVVVFLASPLASYVSGQNLFVDGALSNRFPLKLVNTDASMAG
jgi:3-oxoacyl-[acyl-carrier protein] reductase